MGVAAKQAAPTVDDSSLSRSVSTTLATATAATAALSTAQPTA